MQSTTPIVKDLVLIGGGHSHIAVLKSFGMNPLPGVRLTLISRDTLTPYSGMLPGLIAGHYTIDEAHIDLAPLTRFANARFLRSTVVGIDPATRTIQLKDRPPIAYDVLSINSGSTPSTHKVKGANQFVVPVKPISQFLAHWQTLFERIALRDQPTSISLIGGGAGSVELVLAIQHKLCFAQPPYQSKLSFTLLTADDDILATYPRAVAKRFRRILTERNVRIHTNVRITEIRAGVAIDKGGREFPSDEFLWITHAGAPSWLAEAGLTVDEQGFLLIDDQLRSISDPNIFAAGDVATMQNHRRAKAGVFAVRQGKPLGKNLRQTLLGHTLKSYRPQRRFLTLISTGDQYAIASRGAWSAEGAWVWRWKNWIDKRFMLRYQDLPEMDRQTEQPVPSELRSSEIAELENDPMRCGGCGAKVGADVLTEALRDLKPLLRDDVIVGLKEPDDAALVAVPENKLSVLSVDAFRPMILDPFIFGQITANHCLGDIYAMGAEPQSALTIATLPVWPHQKLVDELRQMLLGALSVFESAQTSLVGGHTSEGAEISLGFSVTGLIEKARVLHKATLKVGDVLILTKAVGTGAILAADMRAKAKGRWVDLAIASMLQSNNEAGYILRTNDASACTDVTGFGLAGHLLEMLGESSLGATLNLAMLPILEGAKECIEMGITSSLQPQNQSSSRRLDTINSVRENTLFPLLFDPQTAGGLLAGVAPANARACIEDLKKHGFSATAIIGEIHKAKDQTKPIRIINS